MVFITQYLEMFKITPGKASLRLLGTALVLKLLVLGRTEPQDSVSDGNTTVSSWECVLLNTLTATSSGVGEDSVPQRHDGCLMLNGFCCQRGIEREEGGDDWRRVDAIRESLEEERDASKTLCVCVCACVCMCVCPCFSAPCCFAATDCHESHEASLFRGDEP